MRVAYDLASGLARCGDQVTVVCEGVYDRGVKDESTEGVTVLGYRLPAASSFRIRRSDRHIEAVTEVLSEHLPMAPGVVHEHRFMLLRYGDRGEYAARCRSFGERMETSCSRWRFWIWRMTAVGVIGRDRIACAGQRPEDERRPAEGSAKDGIGHTGEQSLRHEVRDRPERLGQIGRCCSLLSIVRNRSSSSLRTGST
jgi:hypothetical protein